MPVAHSRHSRRTGNIWVYECTLDEISSLYKSECTHTFDQVPTVSVKSFPIRRTMAPFFFWGGEEDVSTDEIFGGDNRRRILTVS
jgi:hypothetical protein